MNNSVVDGDAVGRRLSMTPLRSTNKKWDPSREMKPARSNHSSAQLQDSTQDFPDHIDQLAMNPSTSAAVRKFESSREKQRSKSKPFSPTLDERSRKVAARMNAGRSSSGDVFSRLHREAEDRKRKLEKRQEARLAEDEARITDEIEREKLLYAHNNAKYVSQVSKVSIVDRLARDDVEARKTKIEKAMSEEKDRKKKQEELEVKKRGGLAMGQPKISRKAKEVKARFMKDWDGSEKKKKLDELRKQQAAEELKDCTFDIKATISMSEEMGHGARSQKLVNRLVEDAGQEQGDRFEALYADAKQRQLRTEQYENWFPEDQTFHPDIGANKYRPTTDASEEEFLNRLTYSKQMTPAAELEERDATTGQPLFHPRTGRAPLFNRNAADLPIGDYLYASGLELEDEKERRRYEAAVEQQESVNRSKASVNSHLLTEGMRRRRLREIFEMMDTDADGIIDAEAANAAGIEGILPDDVANEVIPVVVGVRQPLDFEQFFHLVSAEISYTQTGPRQYLVPERLRHLRALEDYIMNKEGAPYNPKVSTKSKILAQNQRKHRHGSLHDALSEEGQIWDERRRNASEQKAAQDLAKCTFMPNAHLERVQSRGAPNPDEVTRRLSQPARRA